MSVVKLELIDLWQSDFGVVKVPTPMKLALSNAKRKSNGDLDYRYGAAREMRDALNTIARDEYFNG